jgi:preprotein translocase subunit SecF
VKQTTEGTTTVGPARRNQLRREIVWLVGAVLVVDAIFIGFYFLGSFYTASSVVKLTFTAVWTLVLLAVVIRGLSRVRSARLRSTH